MFRTYIKMSIGKMKLIYHLLACSSISQKSTTHLTTQKPSYTHNDLCPPTPATRKSKQLKMMPRKSHQITWIHLHHDPYTRSPASHNTKLHITASLIFYKNLRCNSDANPTLNTFLATRVPPRNHQGKFTYRYSEE